MIKSTHGKTLVMGNDAEYFSDMVREWLPVTEMMKGEKALYELTVIGVSLTDTVHYYTYKRWRVRIRKDTR